MNNTTDFIYNNDHYKFNVVGDSYFGDNVCLLDLDQDLTANTSWSDSGYTITNFLNSANRKDIKNGIFSFIHGLVNSSINFNLCDYHEYISDNEHAEISKQLVGIPIDKFPVDSGILTNFISSLINLDVALSPSHSNELEPNFCLRIVRPNSLDNNPLHRDVWLDRLRNGLNIFFPLTEPSIKTNLGIVPGSHRWKESDIKRTSNGAIVDGKQFTVPSVVSTRKNFNFIRPNLLEDEVLVFSPYLIHGGAINFTNKTRVSLEVRFWKKN
jgi:hypothetical protein